jgi:glutathione synthase/RimK-type ligase-like ATP-grasp enzyme
VTTFCLLSPSRDDAYFESRWAEVFDATAAPLRARGVEVVHRSWAEAADLRSFDLVMPLLAWGYHKAAERWAECVARWEGEGVRLANAASVLRWNSDKTYLARLAERGAPVVPTLFVDGVSEAVLRDAAARFGCARLVAKPVASAGAWRTIRWPDEAVEAGPPGAAMVQPYLASIESAGEVSLLFFGGRFSHAIVKRPRAGDYRVQPEFDGVIAAHVPAADEMAAAELVLGAVGEKLVYARVDLVRGAEGRVELIEVEAIEPDLYLGYDAGGGALFAEAVVEAMT